MYSLKFKRSTNRYSIKELFDNIDEVWKFKKGQPILNDMQNPPSKIHYGTYFNRFGSWKKALKEFIKYKNGGKLKIIEEKLTKTVKRKINNSVRYDVMKKDNFKCCLCGKSPAIDSTITLEIDHIIPISKGGNNDYCNLQTICNKCNNGKGDKN